jgi:tetratricopeptide (TPR) repeat protein
LNNLGALYQARGQHALALRHYRRALAMKTRLLGPGHVDVGVTLNNLATLQRRCGKFTAARTSYERALEIFERCLSPRHPTLIRCRANYERVAERPV